MFLKVKLLTGLGWKASQQIVRKGLQEDLQWLFDPTWHWHEATTSFHWRGHRGDPAKNCNFETQLLAEQKYVDQGWKDWNPIFKRWQRCKPTVKERGRKNSVTIQERYVCHHQSSSLIYAIVTYLHLHHHNDPLKDLGDCSHPEEVAPGNTGPVQFYFATRYCWWYSTNTEFHQ